MKKKAPANSCHMVISSGVNSILCNSLIIKAVNATCCFSGSSKMVAQHEMDSRIKYLLVFNLFSWIVCAKAEYFDVFVSGGVVENGVGEYTV